LHRRGLGSVLSCAFNRFAALRAALAISRSSADRGLGMKTIPVDRQLSTGWFIIAELNRGPSFDTGSVGAARQSSDFSAAGANPA